MERNILMLFALTKMVNMKGFNALSKYVDLIPLR